MRKLGDIPICWNRALFIAARKARPDGVYFVWKLYASVSRALYLA